MAVFETAVVLVGLLNAVILLVRPAARIHARLDFLELEIGRLADEVADFVRVVYSED